MIFFILILIIVILFISYGIYYFIFNIFETTVKITPETPVTNNITKVTCENIPVNAIGKKIPFRKASAEFIIKEGNDLTDNFVNDTIHGILTLYLNGITGTIKIIISSKYSLMPADVCIKIICREKQD